VYMDRRKKKETFEWMHMSMAFFLKHFCWQNEEEKEMNDDVCLKMKKKKEREG
jgi:hypothetical protein